jgi:Tol biopolymer transport system component
VYQAADPISGNVDLWAIDLAGGAPSRLTFHPAVDTYPVCSPAGPEIVFSSLRDGPPNLYRLALSAPGSEKELLRSPLAKIASDWSRDGRLLVYSVLDPKTNFDVMVVPLAGGTPVAFASTEAQECSGRLSPDGRWMAYISDESDTFEVYVQPYPPTGAKWQITKGGGAQPQWNRDGLQLYYIAPDKKLFGVEVRTGGSDLAVGRARALVETRITEWERSNANCQYAVTADGQRFLVNNATDAVLPITMALNWTAALKQ